MEFVRRAFGCSDRHYSTEGRNRMSRANLWPHVSRWPAAVVLMVASVMARSDLQKAGGTFENWAKAHAVPIQTVELESGTADLRRLKPIIGSARVVALGEPAHGAHEPLAFRNRLFRYL